MIETDKKKELLFINEASKLIKRNPKTVRDYVHRGLISHIWIGNRIAFLPEHIDEYLSANTVTAKPKHPASHGVKVNDVVTEMKAKLMSSRT